MEGAYWFWLEGGWHVSGRCISVLVGRWMACISGRCISVLVERWMGSLEFFSCSPMELAFEQEVAV